MKSGIELSSLQRAGMLQSLIASLKSNTNSDKAAVYLANLTLTQVQSVYLLFIEAGDEILSAFSQLPTFPSLVAAALLIPADQCCRYFH
jgi:hypothetical protein